MERHCSAVGLYLRGAANELPACQELEEQEGTAAPQCRAPRAAAVRVRTPSRNPAGVVRGDRTTGKTVTRRTGMFAPVLIEGIKIINLDEGVLLKVHSQNATF